MATKTFNDKNAISGNKAEFDSTVRMIKNSNMSTFKKILAFIAIPFVVAYMFICGLIQLVFYPILYVILTLLYDFDLRNEVAYSIRKVWSIDYWT